MSGYYKVTQILYDIFEGNDDVNTILHGKQQDADYKKNVFPVVHIRPTGVSFDLPQVEVFSFRIASINLVEISKMDVENKFQGNDNQIDSLHSTAEVLNYMFTKLRTQYSGDIAIISNSPAQPIIYSQSNLVVGWYVDVSFAVANDNINVCD